MAKPKTVESQDPTGQEPANSVANVSAEALADAFGKMLEKITANQPSPEVLADALAKAIETSRGIRQIGAGEYRPKGPFNPTGRKRTLKGQFWNNGIQMRERCLSDEEIALLHQITPGRYINKLVTVIQTQTPDGPITQINWSEKTPEQRLNLAKIAPTFTSILQQVVREGAERDAKLGDAKVVEAIKIMEEQRQFSR